ncbi:MAG: hypothetical protein ACR2I0_02160, partial [Rhodoferax sp.]
MRHGAQGAGSKPFDCKYSEEIRVVNRPQLAPQDLIDLSRLLDAALDLPAGAREAWLSRLQGADARLTPRLREMLVQAESNSPAMHLPRLPLYTESVLDELSGDAQSALLGETVTVGPYRLLRELGRGGMGSVWLAERTDGTLR